MSRTTAAAPPVRAIRPNPGPQEAFLASAADIAVYGGAAGGGKTWALLVDPLRWVRRPDMSEYRAVFFRRTYPQIMEAGGPWDQAMSLYPAVGGRPRRTDWVWPTGARVEFRHLQHEADIHAYDGSQIATLLFDELGHFTERQFWYLQSRQRTPAPVRPYIRAATNPPADPEHWLTRLLRWWIADDGFPDPSRAGRVRWFVRDGDDLVWAEDPDALRRYGDPVSVAFFPARVTDNPVLLERDPDYVRRLQALPRVDRERLLMGNWFVRQEPGGFFRREWFGRPLPYPPEDLVAVVRYWDRAATVPGPQNPDPDRTAGVMMGRRASGEYVVLDVVLMRGTPSEVVRAIRRAAEQDRRDYGDRYVLGLEVDPGQAGVAERTFLSRELAGLPIAWVRTWGRKEARARPLSAAAEAGTVRVVRGPWNEPFFRELEEFPLGAHDDQVDAAAGAYYLLTRRAPAWTVTGEEV